MSGASKSLCFLSVILLFGAPHLPAPIQEVQESPTPKQEQSAKPKPKRTIKPKTTGESSESSAKAKTSSPTPKNQPTPNRNPFDGTWSGSLCTNDHRTLFINSTGTVVTEKSAKWGTATWPATCDSVSMRWNTAGSWSWTLTPNPDGKTALATATCPGVFGIGAASCSSVFQRTSP
jgi:hypothetical protein